MNSKQTIAPNMAAKAIRVLVSLALMCMICIPAVPGGAAAPEAAIAKEKFDSNTVVKVKKGDLDGTSGYIVDINGEKQFGFCHDMTVEGPENDWKQYKYYINGNKIEDYIIANGFPSTKKIAGKTWSAADARLITQYASWEAGYMRRGGDYKVFDDDSSDIQAAAKKLIKEAKKYAEDEDDDTYDGTAIVIYDKESRSLQPMLTGRFTREYAHIAIEKKSSTKSATEDNSSYSLKGAEYTVYTDKKCTKEYKGPDGGSVYKLTTNSDGIAKDKRDYEEKTYYLKETKAPEGFELDSKPIKLKAEAQDETDDSKKGFYNWAEHSEQPKYQEIDFLLQKIDEDTQEASAQGNGELSGAVFRVDYCKKKDGTPVRSWYYKTDANGKVNAEKTTSFNGKESDSLYKVDGKVVFYYGHYYVTELKAPKGYNIDKTVSHFPITEDDVFTNAKKISDKPKKGGFQIAKGDYKKYTDEDTGGKGDCFAVAQGDATFKGAEFTVTNKSAKAVKVNGKKYAPGAVVMTITTAYDDTLKAYVASTGKEVLPYGKYEIKETKSPKGYKNTGENLEKTVDVTEDKQFVTYARATDKEAKHTGALNKVITGDVQVVKVDAETQKSAAIGGKDHQALGTEKRISQRSYKGASLTGIEFTIVNRSESFVEINDEYIQPGEEVAKIYTHWNEDKKAYTAETTGNMLPYGTYEITETAANESYPLKKEWKMTFKVREDGTTVTDEVGGKPIVADNQIVRGGFHFTKKKNGEEKLPYVPFVITNVTTGEQHVLVTDDKGGADTEIARNDKVNANDKLLEMVEVGETITSEDVDEAAGIWFSKDENGNTSEPTNDLYGLPYGEYTIVELPCEGNEGMNMIHETYTVTPGDNGRNYDFGTIDDHGMTIATTATDAEDGDKYVAADGTAVIKDAVTYSGLEAGKEYWLEGTIMDKETGKELVDKDEVAYTASKKFKADTSDGTVDLEFAIDATDRGGDQFVVFETIYEYDSETDGPGELIGEHKDINDDDQTVTAEGELATTAVDGADGDKYVSAATETIKVVDTVSYEGLIGGMENCKMEGRLIDADSGEAVVDAEGEEVTSSTTFTVDESGSGTVEMTFEFTPGEEIASKMVVFEKALDAQGNVIGKHEDPNDEGQTVRIPEIRTTFTDKADGDHFASGKATVTDDIYYEGLKGGETYTATLTLHDTEGKALNGKDGKPITKTVEFEATDEAGWATVEMDVDLSAFAGGKVVAFEEVKLDGQLVAKHTDPNDEEQTVYVPKIGTTLTGDEEAKEIYTASEIELTDTIAFSGLKAGVEYTATGTLMDKKTKKPVKYKGKDVTGTSTFTPKESDGTATVTFKFDTSEMAGGSLVAFEDLTADGKLVASHKDINDKDQTVKVTVPKIGTTLTDKTDGDHEALPSSSITLVDEIAYENLTPGVTYTATGTLMDKATEGPVRVDNSDVTATAEFTPKEKNGTAKVTFTFDASRLGGKSLVAFEKVEAQGKLVAVHEDIKDKAQTVKIKGSTPTDEPADRTGSSSEPYSKTGAEVTPFAIAAGILLLAGVALVSYGLYRRKHATAATSTDSEEKTQE